MLLISVNYDKNNFLLREEAVAHLRNTGIDRAVGGDVREQGRVSAPGHATHGSEGKVNNEITPVPPPRWPDAPGSGCCRGRDRLPDPAHRPSGRQDRLAAAEDAAGSLGRLAE